MSGLEASFLHDGLNYCSGQTLVLSVTSVNKMLSAIDVVDTERVNQPLFHNYQDGAVNGRCRLSNKLMYKVSGYQAEELAKEQIFA